MVETKFALRRIITIIWVTSVKKNSQIRTLTEKLFAKYWFFKKLPQILHIHKNRYFLKHNCNFLDYLLLPYKFPGSSMRGILFFKFASCEPLMLIMRSLYKNIYTCLNIMIVIVLVLHVYLLKEKEKNKQNQGESQKSGRFFYFALPDTDR